jgi:hypothetical protein
MSEKIQCFHLKSTGYAQETLRRFTFKGKCPDSTWGGHDITVVLGTVPYPLSDRHGEPGKGIDRDDPRWPTTCSCGYVFQPKDEWQHQLTRLFESSEGLRVVLNDAPPGAFYYADWYPWKGPDGHCLVLVTPGGPWIIDGPSDSTGAKGNAWQRSGELPNITANPSINFPGKYHGWLRGGFLESC